MDGELKKVNVELPSILCNTTSTTAMKKHMVDAESGIRTVKNKAAGSGRCRRLATFPQVVFWLNVLSVKSGILRKFSPREIMLQWKFDMKKDGRVMFGKYCEPHNEPNPSNEQDMCTHKTIALGPTGNNQGTVKFLFVHWDRSEV